MGNAEPAHAGRLERLRERLVRDRRSGAVLTPGANLLYVSGISAGASERLVALLVPARGEPLLVCPAFERERLVGETRVPLGVEAWTDGEDPFSLAARALGAGEWLLDPLTPFGLASRLQEEGARLGSAAVPCAALRRCKDSGELELLGRAQELTRRTLDAARAILGPGITEREVAREILQAFRSAGAEGWALVQFGESGGLPHGGAGERRLTPECAVLVDLGAVVSGYHGDLTRSWWFGESPPAEYAAVSGVVEEAHARAVALARPGASAGDLDAAARRHMADAGFGERFSHRLGHGVGLEIHEEPFLLRGSDVRLEPGDVFTIEPGAYLPDAFGVRHEDVYAMEEGGARRL